MQKQIFCRWAPSLGELEDTALNVWGTPPYDPKVNSEDPVVFFGLYGLPDFYELWRHKGKKYILWAGSDIRHFVNGYWLDNEGKIKLKPHGLAKWINKFCESWVENEMEKSALLSMGIETKIGPSFLGDVNKFKVSYEYSEKPKLYSSVSGDNFGLYRWPEIMLLALKYPNYEFHLYGNTVDCPYTSSSNVIFHGRIPKEQMNQQTRNMQGSLRLLPFEGFSEIIAKSILWGQWPISEIKYPYTLSMGEIGLLREKTEPNLLGRDYYLKTFNNFPWNVQKY